MAINPSVSFADSSLCTRAPSWCFHARRFNENETAAMRGHGGGFRFPQMRFRGLEVSWARSRSEMMSLLTRYPRGVSTHLPVSVWTAW